MKLGAIKFLSLKNIEMVIEEKLGLRFSASSHGLSIPLC